MTQGNNQEERCDRLMVTTWRPITVPSLRRVLRSQPRPEPIPEPSELRELLPVHEEERQERLLPEEKLEPDPKPAREALKHWPERPERSERTEQAEEAPVSD